MPKSVKVSLTPITKEIEKATAKLEGALSKVANPKFRKKLQTNIKNLKQIDKEVRQECRTTSHFIVVPVA